MDEEQRNDPEVIAKYDQMKEDGPPKEDQEGEGQDAEEEKKEGDGEDGSQKGDVEYIPGTKFTLLVAQHLLEQWDSARL